MKISVTGCGYLGAVHAACLAELGHEVVGVDVDETKIRMLAAGHPPFFEPGLPELLTSRHGDRPAEFHHRHRGRGRGAGALRLRRHAAAAGRVTPPT